MKTAIVIPARYASTRLPGKPLLRQTGKYLGHKETLFQNVWSALNESTGRPQYRLDIMDQQLGNWIQGCPSTEGGHNWPASTWTRRSSRRRSASSTTRRSATS